MMAIFHHDTQFFWSSAEVEHCAGCSLTLCPLVFRPDLLDSSLMRPGRLDKLLYVGIAQRTQDKLKVLQALTRKFRLAASVDLQRIAEQCGSNLTGADLYALCADAWMAALRRITALAQVSNLLLLHPRSFWDAGISLRLPQNCDRSNTLTQWGLAKPPSPATMSSVRAWSCTGSLKTDSKFLIACRTQANRCNIQGEVSHLA